MGIFDIFKTKVKEGAGKVGDVAGQTWDKAGDVAEQAKDKVSDLRDKKKDAGPEAPQSATGAEPRTEGQASNMVSEGAPIADEGEAAPGVGDDGGMTQSIKGNVASGVEKAGEMAKGATGNKYDDKIDSGVQKAKDKLR